MSFNPGHSAVVLFKVEAGSGTGSITESTDGTTAASLPSIPTSPSVLGYTDIPTYERGLNNAKGFAIGMVGAAYNKRGSVQPSITVNIRPGNVAALAAFLNADGTTGVLPDTLPYFCLYMTVKGQGTVVFRYCKPASVQFNFSGGDGQDGEVTIAMTFQAMAMQTSSAITVAESAIRALGTPLMWHDVRTFNVTPQGGSATGYRKSLMSLSAEINYNLERKNVRPNWGDNAPLSRTSYELLEHHRAATGEIGLHGQLSEAMFTGIANAQDWGDIVLLCSDAALGLTEKKGFTLTFQNAMPTNENESGGESSSEINYSVPFAANDVKFLLDAA